MATFNLTINYPDGQAARIAAALQSHYGVTTNAAAIEAFRKEVVSRLRIIVAHEERKSAVSTVVEVDPS